MSTVGALQRSASSRLASWWSFERAPDHVASYAALALGLAALVVAIVYF